MSEFEPPARQDALASVGQRALAQALDGLVLLLPAFLVVYLTTGEILASVNDDSKGSQLWATFILVILQITYNTVCVAVWGATLGKRIVGLRVVNQTDGGPVSFNYAAVRALIPSAAGLIPVIGMAAPIVIYMRAFFHPLRKGWHDQAAGTIVVRR